MTTVYTGALALNQTVTPAAVALASFKGVAVSLFVKMNGADSGTMPEVGIAFAISIDGGTTYADPVDLGLEVPFSSTGHEVVVDMLTGAFATHAKFTLTNNDPVNSVNLVTLSVQPY